MTPLSLGVDIVAGWCVWSLAHNLGHRWWHVDMRAGKKTFYAHGESEHHRLYDADYHAHRDEDPLELFISFPYKYIAPAALLIVAAVGAVFGWAHALGFFLGFHGSMSLDHFSHVAFHKRDRLPGFFGRLQDLHRIHHTTHRNNYFFVSGYVWDLLLGTLLKRRPVAVQELRPAPLRKKARAI